jgi:hypothetical protein
LQHGGTIEPAQQIANYESPRTTKLHDRTNDAISLDEIERILIQASVLQTLQQRFAADFVSRSTFAAGRGMMNGSYAEEWRTCRSPIWMVVRP